MKLLRREFLFRAAVTSLAFAVNHGLPPAVEARQYEIPKTSIPTNRVVHVHSDDVTYWDYVTGWYGDYVSQVVVDTMIDNGVMELTGTGTRTDAWRAIIPTYTADQAIAIKINLNNAIYDDRDSIIDALPQPINSVIQGLKAIGVPENNIWIYDVTSGWHSGTIPSRLINKIIAIYPNVQFHSNDSGCSTTWGYSTSQKVHFNVPAGRTISDRPICQTLVQASYLINMPIMKKHIMAGVTLGFKNHFGSIESCDQVHWSVTLSDTAYLSTYNALVDIYSNAHFKNKTVLTIGDGLYGARINNYSEVPSRWPTFGNKSPNSLFFSTNPVAIDCVMYDFLKAEGGVPTGSDDYLKLAAASGLGTFEHRDAWHQYHTIDYRLISLDQSQQVYLPSICRGD